MTTLMYDNSADILLENILMAMESETFCKDTSARIVGGEARLMGLIKKGEIRAEKRSTAQNGKIFCRAADVLRHCTPRRKRRNKFGR